MQRFLVGSQDTSHLKIIPVLGYSNKCVISAVTSRGGTVEHRAGLSAAEREIERIEVRRKKLIEMVMDGVPPAEVKDEMIANAARREELKAGLAAADEPPPLLHPGMADLYRQKVTALAQALEQPAPETGDLSLQVVMVAGAGFEPATFGL